MKNKSLLKISIVIFVAIILGVIAFALLSSTGSETSTESQMEAEENSETQIESSENPSENRETSMDTEMNSEAQTQSEVDRYQEYNEAALELAENNEVVIFFHADWCPSCSVLDKDILENESEIPEDVVILRADYDEETELKQKYGVNYQHTLVQVDENGDELNQWAGSFNLEDIVNQLDSLN